MSFLKEGDGQKIFQDPEMVDQIVAELSREPKLLSELADNLADALEETIKEDSVWRQKILSAIAGNDAIRSRVAHEISQKYG